MKIVNLFFVLAVAAVMASCSSSNMQTVDADTFTLDVDKGMQAAAKGSLDEESVLEYEDSLSDLYMIVNRYKSGDPGLFGDPYTYSGLVEETVFILSDKEKEMTTSTGKIDDLNATTGETTIETPDGSVFYATGIIEGKNHLYRIVCWTGSSSKEKNRELMLAMINSFHEK